MNLRTRFKHVWPWTGHILVWLGLTAFAIAKDTDLEWGLFSRRENTLFWPVCYGTLFNALLFYGNALWLMPRWLKRQRQYLIYTACAVLILTLAETGIDVWYALRQPSIVTNIRVVFQDKMPGPWTDAYIQPLLTVYSFSLNLFLHLVFWALSLAFGLYRERVQHEKMQDLLLKEKMRAELNYLRAQINPHFLFNGINSIYHLIDQDAEKAKDVLLRFSGLLRYQLYECSTDSIALDKEFDYLENYISLEKIRKGGDAIIEFAISASHTPLKIAPMLLTPLVENAFKYLSQYTEPELNRLHIDLSVENSRLELVVRNTFQPEINTNPKNGGLGLQNVRTRLSLLYPGKHQLTIAPLDGVFQVQLQITLHHA